MDGFLFFRSKKERIKWTVFILFIFLFSILWKSGEILNVVCFLLLVMMKTMNYEKKRKNC